MRILCWVYMLSLVLLTSAWAQHHEPAETESVADDMPAHTASGMQQAAAHPATHMENPIGIPLSRYGSGTSWLPDSTPMYAVMLQSGKWSTMYHGAAFPMYDSMNGPRGDEKVVLANWAMAMAHRRLDQKSDLLLSAMVSLEPLTVGGAGYPLLFQTGETWNGQPLKDHQHPHNYISELSAYYTRALSSSSAALAYFGPVGEPAFGPVTYLHRTFGLDDPLAPIGHHWQDATHITFWVATAGY